MYPCSCLANCSQNCKPISRKGHCRQADYKVNGLFLASDSISVSLLIFLSSSFAAADKTPDLLLIPAPQDAALPSPRSRPSRLVPASALLLVLSGSVRLRMRSRAPSEWARAVRVRGGREAGRRGGWGLLRHGRGAARRR